LLNYERSSAGFNQFKIMIKLRKQIEDKLKELGATIVDSGTFTDNSGSDILFKINDKQYYIEMTEENDIKELIDKEFIQ